MTEPRRLRIEVDEPGERLALRAPPDDEASGWRRALTAYFGPLQRKRLDAEDHLALRASWVCRAELDSERIAVDVRKSPNGPLVSLGVSLESITCVYVAAVEDLDGVWHHSVTARYRLADRERTLYVPLLVTAVDLREEAWDLVFRIARALGMHAYRDVGDGPDGDIRLEMGPEMRAGDDPYRGATSDIRAVPASGEVADYAAESARSFHEPREPVAPFDPSASAGVRVHQWEPGERVHMVRPRLRRPLVRYAIGALFTAFVFGYVVFYAFAIMLIGGGIAVGLLATLLWAFGIDITGVIDSYVYTGMAGLCAIAGFAGAAVYLSDSYQAIRARAVVIDWAERSVAIDGEMTLDFDVVRSVASSGSHDGCVELRTRDADVTIARNLGHQARSCATDLARALGVPVG